MKKIKIRKNFTGIAALLSVLGIALLSFSCGSSTATSPEAMENLQQLVDQRHFEIENDWAIPLRGSQINLIGNPNYIRFKNDSVELFLPYFGVRHSGGGYNSEGGIKYEGIAQDLEIRKNKAGNTEILFEGQQQSESLDFRITLYPNLNAQTHVTSSQRDPISYKGEVHEWKEQE